MVSRCRAGHRSRPAPPGSRLHRRGGRRARYRRSRPCYQRRCSQPRIDRRPNHRSAGPCPRPAGRSLGRSVQLLADSSTARVGRVRRRLDRSRHRRGCRRLGRRQRAHPGRRPAIRLARRFDLDRPEHRHRRDRRRMRESLFRIQHLRRRDRCIAGWFLDRPRAHRHAASPVRPWETPTKTRAPSARGRRLQPGQESSRAPTTAP